jgi:hypothetical protein
MRHRSCFFSPARLAPVFACALLATATSARAELIVVDGQVQLRASTAETPRRGTRMSDVEARFGAPLNRAAAVGEPPITRWDYDGFSVYFERDLVLHSVARGS